MNTPDLFLQPFIQYGFMGFSAVLLAVIVWLIKRLLRVLERNNEIVAANTAAMQSLLTTTSDLMVLSRSLHDKIISRPCISCEEQ